MKHGLISDNFRINRTHVASGYTLLCSYEIIRRRWNEYIPLREGVSLVYFEFYSCFLNPFITARTRPIKINTILTAANAHLREPKIIVSQAKIAGFAGYMASMETMPAFSSMSKKHPPTGITFHFCMRWFELNPRWKSQDMSSPKNRV